MPSRNLIGLPPFWGISPRNSTSFTRPFLTGRHTRGGHETSVLPPMWTFLMINHSALPITLAMLVSEMRSYFKTGWRVILEIRFAVCNTKFLCTVASDEHF